ncbi:DUF1275 family protein, partial [Burkholderia gladioli]|nr:DUF1275 family protein [Burkholderia gladioli]
MSGTGCDLGARGCAARTLRSENVLLAFVAGYVDTLGFVALSGLFVAHVTGNFILIGSGLAGAGRRGLYPLREVLDLAPRVLREQVVGDAQAQLVAPGQFHDHGVVVGIGLVAAARVDRAGHAEPVQL